MDVFITVDVEHGGSSFARRNADRRPPPATLDCVAEGRPYGLPFIVDTLAAGGLRATFFVEPLSGFYYGERPMGDAVAMLAARGMDVQLHAHPAWLRFADGRERSDKLHAFAPREQEEIIATARGLLEGFGARITAFRAGGFGADNATYGVLRELGIPYSSSYNLGSLGDGCRIRFPDVRNDCFRADGVVEIPLTNYLIRDMRRAFGHAARHFQLGSTSARHGKELLSLAERAGMRSVNILLHNFEFVRREREDWFLGPFRPHDALIAGFQELCAFLAGNPDRFTVRTFGELGPQWLGEGSAGRPGHLPKVSGIYWPL